MSTALFKHQGTNTIKIPAFATYDIRITIVRSHSLQYGVHTGAAFLSVFNTSDRCPFAKKRDVQPAVQQGACCARGHEQAPAGHCFFVPYIGAALALISSVMDLDRKTMKSKRQSGDIQGTPSIDSALVLPVCAAGVCCQWGLDSHSPDWLLGNFWGLDFYVVREIGQLRK
jgi:hypothetical protein